MAQSTPAAPVLQLSVSTANSHTLLWEDCIFSDSLITYFHLCHHALWCVLSAPISIEKCGLLKPQKAIMSHSYFKQGILFFAPPEVNCVWKHMQTVPGCQNVTISVISLTLSSSALRPRCWRLWWLGLRPGSEIFLHLRVAWRGSIWLPAARVSDQAHMRGDHAGRQVHCGPRAEEPLLKCGTARTPANSAPLYQPPAPPTSQPSPARIHGYRAPPAMFPHCAWQNVKMSANNKINDPSPHAESIFLCVYDNIVSGTQRLYCVRTTAIITLSL